MLIRGPRALGLRLTFTGHSCPTGKQINILIIDQPIMNFQYTASSPLSLFHDKIHDTPLLVSESKKEGGKGGSR